MLRDMRDIGTITPRPMKDGTVRYRVRITAVDGTRKSMTFSSRDEAERALQGFVSQFGPRREMTLRQWGAHWLDLRDSDRAHRSVKRERSVWRCHVLAAAFVDRPLRSITRAQVHAWVQAQMRTKALVSTGKSHAPSGRQVSRSVVHSALSLLRAAMHAAADAGLVPTNVAHGVRAPKLAKDDDGWTYLTEEEIEAVLALSMRSDQSAVLRLAIFSGLRAGELWGLRWCDVRLDGERPELHVRRSYRSATKGGRTRHVPLLYPAIQALIDWKKTKPGIGSALVFPADTSKRYPEQRGGCHASGYDAGWARLRRRAGLKRPGRRVVFHDLRHTCASHLVMGTWTRRALRLEEVRQWLGHKSILVTERYAHLSPDWLHEALDHGRSADLDRMSDDG